MTRAHTRVLRLVAAPLVVGALVLGSIAPAQADGRGPGPGQGGPATAEPVMTTMLSGNVAALTFDDGPNPETAPRLLEVLEENDAKAVFCLIGEYVEQHPDVVRQLVAAGHTLCNHSMYHTPGIGGWSEADLRADMEATSAAIQEAVGGVPVPYYRVPYGRWGLSAQVAADLGMQPLGATFVIFDWETQDVDVLAERLETQLRANPGGIALLHDGAAAAAATTDRTGTVEALAQVLPELRAEGWKFHKPARRG
ncbi:polysaccharide deacetylase family protein [Microbacterium hominis]|uniref:Polysaccharide deacetylase family protein n=1 Tax=Microbacterium hominis TaxID=162426 RepID=A0A7D4PZC6_9MICO|nr:polysaccharide deacetylase family protein [Microbacterium hominis]QKJ18252.1 polysaccharide deacetylase family protein [Microbacterium hominis]